VVVEAREVQQTVDEIEVGFALERDASPRRFALRDVDADDDLRFERVVGAGAAAQVERQHVGGRGIVEESGVKRGHRRVADERDLDAARNSGKARARGGPRGAERPRVHARQARLARRREAATNALLRRRRRSG